MRTAVDTNVLSCLLGNERLSSYVASTLDRASREGAVVVCGTVYAELLAHPLVKPGVVDQFLGDVRISVDTQMDIDLWRSAGGVFAGFAARKRRVHSKEPRRLLADFVIGAHALNRADRLLTFDTDFYKREFPKLCLLRQDA